MNPIKKLQMKALEKLGKLLTDLEYETDPVAIEAKLMDIKWDATTFHEEIRAQNWQDRFNKGVKNDRICIPA